MSPVYQHVTLPQGVLPSQVVDVSTVFGPFFLAQCFNWALYGVLCLQVYIYLLRFPKDLTYIKTLVYSVFFLDTFFMATITHAAWQVLVQNWGDVNILHLLPWTWAMVPVGSGVVSMIVQLFFVWRIWKLSKSYKMPVIICFFTLLQCAFAIRTGFIAADVRTFHYIRDLQPGIWLVSSIIADILTCASLVHILWNSQTGFKDTDGVVFRLIRLTVEAAAVPVLAATFKLALIYSYHDNRHLVFCVVLGRLYSNSFLAMLNCRDPMFGGGSSPNTLAGAARLSDEPVTLMSLIKQKLSFGSTSSRGSVSFGGNASRDQFTSMEKNGQSIHVHKSVRSQNDLESGRRHTQFGINFPRRGSNDRDSVYTMTSFGGRPTSIHHIDTDAVPESPTTADLKTTSNLLSAVPPSPTTAAAQGWMRRPSEVGMHETTSQFVAALPANGVGRSVTIVTAPPPALMGRSSERGSWESGSAGRR